tara:strand:+ start:667 stop:1347 length:681 start_codon:yes stop_codon:yes gene_type:complete
MNSIIFKQSPIGEIVDADENNGIVKGYASYFDNIDADKDIIRAGAYKKTIMENGSRVKYLYQHDMKQPLGKMQELYEDDKGLVFVASVPKTQLGKDVIELMKAGVITENSVGIMPIVKEEKGSYREIREVKLYEISAVTIAANEEAKILDVKGSLAKEAIFSRYDNLVKIIRKNNISDELAFAIESEILKLKSHLKQITESPQNTLPKKDKNDSELLKYLFNNLKK